MNAGAYGKEMKEILKEVTCMDEEMNIHTLKNEYMDFHIDIAVLKKTKKLF